MTGLDGTGGPSTAGGTRAGPDGDPTWERLEDQIAWYDRRSGAAQRWYKRLKLLEVAVAAALPVVAAGRASVWVTGAMAAAIVVLESAQHIHQFQEHWITYRSTAESLKHERFLYLAAAGPYAHGDRHRQLAERLESLTSQEHAKWAVTQRDERVATGNQPGGPAGG